MASLKATFLFTSLVSGLALNLLPAAQLQQQQQQVNSTDISVQTINQILQSGHYTNATTSPNLDTEPGDVICSSTLGQDLLPTSCRDAYRRLDGSSVDQTWGPRDRGFSRGLPQRVLSCKYPQMKSYPRRNLDYSRFSLSLIAADGLCAIDPFVTLGKPSAIGTNLDVKGGAAKVIHLCGVKDNKHKGGLASDISKHL